MKQYDALLDAYEKQLGIRGIGASTILNRRREIERFGLWIKRKKPRPNLSNISAELILEYLKERSAFKARTTIQSKFSDLRCFFEYLVQENVWKKNPLRWIPGPKIILNSHIPKSLKPSEVELLFQQCFQVKEILFQYEMPVIFLTLYSLGLRRGELVNLNFNDWDQREKTLRVRVSKNGRERFMPIPESLERAIEAYLPIRQNVLIKRNVTDEQALFIDGQGKRISGVNVSRRLFGCAKRAGLSKFNVHQLRHTCATNLFAKGVPLPEVKMVLGHASISTTQRYTHVAGPERWQAIQKHPLNNYLSQQGESPCPR